MMPRLLWVGVEIAIYYLQAGPRTRAGPSRFRRKAGLPCLSRLSRPTMSFLTNRVSQTLSTPLLRASMAPRVAARTFVATPLRFESHPPILQGEGAKEGEVATEENQSTGIERFEYMGHLQGVDVFDMEPLDASRVGTMKDPIMVRSMVRSVLTSALRTWN